MTPADVQAMDWIRNNTLPGARFAINTVFWLPYFPHGTDGGYWIPYFTGRETTAGSMLFSQGSQDYANTILSMSRSVEHVETDDAGLAQLASMGVNYIYLGAKGNFAGQGLGATRLDQTQGVTLVYRRDGVSIFQIQK